MSDSFAESAEAKAAPFKVGVAAAKEAMNCLCARVVKITTGTTRG